MLDAFKCYDLAIVYPVSQPPSWKPIYYCPVPSLDEMIITGSSISPAYLTGSTL
jgi:hypothetical protein